MHRLFFEFLANFQYIFTNFLAVCQGKILIFWLFSYVKDNIEWFRYEWHNFGVGFCL